MSSNCSPKVFALQGFTFWEFRGTSPKNSITKVSTHNVLGSIRYTVLSSYTKSHLVIQEAVNYDIRSIDELNLARSCNMPRIGLFELIIVMFIILVVFGVGKLPEIGGAMGKGIRAFKKGQSEEYEDEKEKGT